MSCTVALDANSIPTFTFSLSSLLVDWGHSEELCGHCVVAGVIGTRSGDLAVSLDLDDLTVLSYRDTTL